MGLFLLALRQHITPFKMKKIAWLYTLLFPFFNHAQYWQQKTDYTIHVRLDDTHHFLHGELSLLYTNNSPQALSEIRFHLWPNAYKSPSTPMNLLNGSPYGQELLMDPKNQGYMDSVDFKVNGQPVRISYTDEFQEMAIVHLSTPLQPGTQIEITTPFRVKIPHNGVSRLGHYMNSYQITQWYPKPAVYDHKGWHHMPYLTQGEFYSEFGSFDVSITVPENYVVGATGNLQTESEKQFIENKVSKAPAIIDSLSQLKQSKIVKENQLWNPVIPSSNQWKTVRYTLDNIHDFAFFAEKGYIVRSGSVTLPHSGREVQLYAMYYPSNYKIWNNSIDYLRDAVYYYSLWNGDYPYDVCTAVDGAIAAGGGMEYPTITVIGNCSDTTELDLVIAHEVGHNWFYGILGSNERQHGWMDEGVNSFNEMRYMDLKYPNYNTLESIIDARFIGNRFHLNHHQLNRLSAAVIQQLSIHQVLNTHSSDFQSINYGVDMYQRTAISLGYLQTYLGEQLFDQCMQTYYERWKFKHPYPEDMQKVFEEVSGKPLNWFFKDLIETRAITDYTIRSVKTKDGKITVKIGNPGQLEGPKVVHLIKDQKIVAEAIAEPDQDEVTFDATIAYDYVTLDYNNQTGDIYLHNNRKGFKSFDKETKSVGFFTGLDIHQYRKIYFLPTIGVNELDGFQAGFAMHNYAFPLRRFQYLVNPMFGFESKHITGIADFNWRMNHLKQTSGSMVGFALKSFQNFIALLPYWRVNLNNPNKVRHTDQQLTLQGIGEINKGIFEEKKAGLFAQYEITREMGAHRLEGKFRASYIGIVDHNYHNGRVTAAAKYNMDLGKFSNFLEVRVFAGINNLFQMDYVRGDFGMMAGGNTGQTDLFRESTYFTRSSLLANQRDSEMGGMGGMGIATNEYANTLLLTSRVSIGIPKMNFLRPYADFAFGDLQTNYNNHFVAGMALQLREWVGIYFPLYSTRHQLYTSNYGDYMSFYLKWNFVMNPIRIKSFL